jgi:hypothetical protein
MAKVTGNMTPRTTISHSTFLRDDLTDHSYCSMGALELLGGQKIGCQATQVMYKITILEEYTR